MKSPDPAKAELFAALLDQRDRLTGVIVYVIRAAGPVHHAQLNAMLKDELTKEK